jgi:hypothetical protein
MGVVKGIIDDFIREKVEGHKEPQRKGTPKGDPIGFSLQKYTAALMSLTYLPQATITTILGIKSHGLLRKWHTEKEFEKAIEKYGNEFADRYLEVILENKSLRHNLDEYLKHDEENGEEDLYSIPDLFQVHKDNDVYGFRLRGPLVGRLLKQAQESTDIVRIIGALSALATLLNPPRLIRLRKTLEIQKKLSMQPREIKNQARLICTKEIRSRLLEQEFSTKEKKIALCLLKIIEELDP